MLKTWADFNALLTRLPREHLEILKQFKGDSLTAAILQTRQVMQPNAKTPDLFHLLRFYSARKDRQLTRKYFELLPKSTDTFSCLIHASTSSESVLLYKKMRSIGLGSSTLVLRRLIQVQDDPKVALRWFLKAHEPSQDMCRALAIVLLKHSMLEHAALLFKKLHLFPKDLIFHLLQHDMTLICQIVSQMDKPFAMSLVTSLVRYSDPSTAQTIHDRLGHLFTDNAYFYYCKHFVHAPQSLDPITKYKAQKRFQFLQILRLANQDLEHAKSLFSQLDTKHIALYEALTESNEYVDEMKRNLIIPTKQYPKVYDLMKDNLIPAQILQQAAELDLQN